MRVIRSETGAKVTNLPTAEKVVALWSKETTTISSLTRKADVLREVAEVKGLIHRSVVPITEIETAFWDHPDAPEVSKHHKKNYHCVINRLIAFAQRRQIKKVGDFTEDDATAFLSENWSRGIAAKTYNASIDILRSVFRLLNKDVNPFAGFKKKHAVSENREAFSIEDLQKIWKTLIADDYFILHKEEMIVLYKLALYTGARCGDLCLMKWESVDLQNRLIRFIPHKTAQSSRKQVEIPINDILFEALMSLDKDDVYVLPRVAERYKKNPGGISRDTKKLLEAAGLTPNVPGEMHRLRQVSRLGFHSFRHSYVSLLINSGVNPLVVRDLVGHTTVDMTARYTHVAMENKIQAVDVLPVLGIGKKVTSMSDTPTIRQQIISALEHMNDRKLQTVLDWILMREAH